MNLNRHPLDIDLARYVLGELEQAQAAVVKWHLSRCSLCRLKCVRLQRWKDGV